MGSASAYSAVLRSIDTDVTALITQYPDMFSVPTTEEAIVEIRDFQTAGVVAFARGCPFYAQRPGRADVLGRRVQVKDEYLQNCIQSLQTLVDKL